MDGAVERFVKVELSEPSLTLPEDRIVEQIRENIERDLPQVFPHHKNDRPIALVGGGPTLLQTLDELQDCVDQGYQIVATNGSARFLVEKGFRIHGHVLLDAREQPNLGFVTPRIEGITYLVASQCHPSVFEALEGERVVMWHGGTVKHCKPDLDRKYGKGKYWIIRTGSTVMLASLGLLMTLGYHRFECFGWDSCLVNGAHHAYDQPENNLKTVVSIRINGRLFNLHPWMSGQADDALMFFRVMGDKLDLVIHGDGLLSWILDCYYQDGQLNIEDLSHG